MKIKNTFSPTDKEVPSVIVESLNEKHDKIAEHHLSSQNIDFYKFYLDI